MYRQRECVTIPYATVDRVSAAPASTRQLMYDFRHGLRRSGVERINRINLHRVRGWSSFSLATERERLLMSSVTASRGLPIPIDQPLTNPNQ